MFNLEGLRALEGPQRTQIMYKRLVYWLAALPQGCFVQDLLHVDQGFVRVTCVDNESFLT